jgi:release factor glutamine methyltransferase
MNKGKLHLFDGTMKQIRASEAEERPYAVEVAGKAYVVNPGVFSPRYFGDTEFFAGALAKHLTQDIRFGRSLLEIGPGIGAVSVHQLSKGNVDYVVASDINPEAVINTMQNVALHGYSDKVEVFCGDVFDALPKEPEADPCAYDCFANIFWNVPFMSRSGVGVESLLEGNMLERAVHDPRHRAVRKFFGGASERLANPEGRLFVGYSNDCGDHDLLTRIASRSGYQLVLREHARVEEGIPGETIGLELYEAVRLGG